MTGGGTTAGRRGGRTATVVRSCAACSALLCLLFLACRASPEALDRVLESGTLRVGMDASFPPFEAIDGEGNVVGFDVDLAREIAARMGVRAQFVANLPYDGLYDALTTGRVDVVVSALYVDPRRMADFAYSSSYFNAGQVLVVGPGEEISEMADLGGRRLAVALGSEGDVVARSWERRLINLTITPCPSAMEALALVAAGEADAALADHLSALIATAQYANLRLPGDPVTDEPYAVAVLRESRGLLRAVNQALADIAADGTGARLREKWFSTAP